MANDKQYEKSRQLFIGEMPQAFYDWLQEAYGRTDDGRLISVSGAVRAALADAAARDGVDIQLRRVGSYREGAGPRAYEARKTAARKAETEGAANDHQ